MQRPNIFHFKAFGMINLHYEVRICQKIYYRVTMTVYVKCVVGFNVHKTLNNGTGSYYCCDSMGRNIEKSWDLNDEFVISNLNELILDALSYLQRVCQGKGTSGEPCWIHAIEGATKTRKRTQWVSNKFDHRELKIRWSYRWFCRAPLKAENW